MITKYTREQEAELYDKYKQCETADERDVVVEQAIKKFNKTKKSIVAKLSKMDIYISRTKISKVTGTKPETKEQIVDKIETAMLLQGQLDGLSKAPKLVLMKILSKIKFTQDIKPRF